MDKCRTLGAECRTLRVANLNRKGKPILIAIYNEYYLVLPEESLFGRREVEGEPIALQLREFKLWRQLIPTLDFEGSRSAKANIEFEQKFHKQ